MSFIVPLVGSMALINKMLIAALYTDEGYTLKLFQNNASINAYTATSDLQEANFSGYEPVLLTRAQWKAPVLVGTKAVCLYENEITWTAGAISNTIYGYYVVESGSGVLLWCYKFEQEYFMSDGDTLIVQPSFALRGEALGL